MWHHMADYIVANYVLFLASIFIAVIIFYTSAKKTFFTQRNNRQTAPLIKILIQINIYCWLSQTQGIIIISVCGN